MLEHIKNVMVVDDDPQFVDYLTGILKSEGLHVRSAHNCLDALHIVSDYIPDIFLIDLIMPTITGDRLCRILGTQKHLAGSYRVIVSSLEGQVGMDLEAIGAHACVAKEPWKIMTENLFGIMRYLDQNDSPQNIDKEPELEKDKSAMKERLQHAQKMEAVGTLAGGIAHDFNNILQAILGYAQLSLFESEIPPVVRENLVQIQTSAQKATSLIRRLLVFCRKVDSQQRPIDLNHQICHVVHMLERIIPRMIQIESQLDEDLKWIKADGNLLEQILMNLGVNARDAMPDGGRLIFQTRNIDLDDAFCKNHPGAMPGPYVQLTVTDNGIGMTDDVRNQIFDPFFTTKKSGQGTGLGLAMVYGIVKDHDGFITCQSNPGKGTAFFLYFPAIAAEDNAAAHPEAVVSVPGGTETILLIDDESGIRDFGQKILEKHGYTVIVAQSGEEAIETYRRWEQGIDLVIVDLGMPGMGGLKCIEYLKRIHPDCRMIASSGYADDDLIASAREAGAREFVAKPYFVRDLLAKIRYMMNIS